MFNPFKWFTKNKPAQKIPTPTTRKIKGRKKRKG
jgi:hypothetical protein